MMMIQTASKIDKRLSFSFSFFFRGFCFDCYLVEIDTIRLPDLDRASYLMSYRHEKSRRFDLNYVGFLQEVIICKTEIIKTK